MSVNCNICVSSRSLIFQNFIINHFKSGEIYITFNEVVVNFICVHLCLYLGTHMTHTQTYTKHTQHYWRSRNIKGPFEIRNSKKVNKKWYQYWINSPLLKVLNVGGLSDYPLILLKYTSKVQGRIWDFHMKFNIQRSTPAVHTSLHHQGQWGNCCSVSILVKRKIKINIHTGSLWELGSPQFLS